MAGGDSAASVDRHEGPTGVSSTADIALARAEWQSVIFARQPRRLALLGLEAPWPLRRIKISVLRNHSVETTVSVSRGFLAYAGYRPEWVLSAYDDALPTPPIVDADVHLVWVDVSRYATDGGRDTAAWFAERLTSLRRDLRGPIIVVGPPADGVVADHFVAVLNVEAARLPDVHVFPLSMLAEQMGSDVGELRASETGTRISGAGAAVIAQHLGLQWIPAVLRPRLKAVIVDLDNTLVGGVLAEDGTHGVDIAGGYARLRAHLLALQASGLFLVLISKNDLRDVERLFTERPSLRELRTAFMAVEAGWRPKAESIAMTLARLGIGMDSALIVDDNAGEIAAMAAALGDAWFVLAREPGETTRALSLHPGLLALRKDELAHSRSADLEAAERRSAGAKSAIDPRAYLASLQMRVDLRMNPSADRSRLSELSRKTNQFNTTLARYSEVEVDEYLRGGDRCVVSARLRDRLSDSGMIAAIFARRVPDAAVIDEIAFSCRALGRALEPAIIAEVLDRIAGHFDVGRVQIPFVEGPRNGPARAWVDEFTVMVEGGIREITNMSTLHALTRTLPVELCWGDDHA
jgi:FkbH-like protein